MNHTSALQRTPRGPLAPARPTFRTHHGDTFEDDFEWLRNLSDPEVLELLKAEQEFTAERTQHLQPLRQRLFQEIKDRTVETSVSVPVRHGDWWYTVRTTEDTQYARYYRFPAQNTGQPEQDFTAPVLSDETPREDEELILDCNALAEGQEYFALGALAFSRDRHLMAYAVDTQGNERFTIRIKDLRTGELFPEAIEGAFYALEFDYAGKRLFYTVVDSTWRPHQIKVHTLGTDPSEDTILFTEENPQLWLDCAASEDYKELIITTGHSEHSHSYRWNTVDAQAQIQPLAGHEETLLHSIGAIFEQEGHRYYVVVHNRQGPNNMVSVVREDQWGLPLAQQQWATVLQHRDEVKIDGVSRNRSWLCVAARKDTAPRVLALPLAQLTTAQATSDFLAECAEPHFEHELYSLYPGAGDIDSDLIRLSFESFTTPEQVWDWWLPEQRLRLCKETPIPNFSAADYITERMWATASDGTQIPLSVLRHRRVEKDGTAPLFIYGYGSYEMSLDPHLSRAILSLLDRGVVYVDAHVRGGGELGRSWYTAAKKQQKVTTFTDFIDATKAMIASGWVDPKKVAASGASAGGLLMGAITNMAPELYSLIIAGVPFVDPLTSILDPELPLSALEWEEWGNPITDAQCYHYMRSYSPYENVTDQHYPTVLAVTNINDTRVLAVEPAKWVQQLRRHQQAEAPIMLKIDMEGGHGGGSGRHKGWEDIAFEHALALAVFGLADREPLK